MAQLKHRQFNQLCFWLAVGLLILAAIVYYRGDYVRLWVVLGMLVLIPIIWLGNHFANRRLIKLLKTATPEESEKMLARIKAEDPDRAEHLRDCLRNGKS